METNCISCDEQVIETANFCHKCGAQQKCKVCSTVIIKGANNCTGCGIVLSQPSTNASQNTIKFKQTAHTRSYEIAFSDKVGANVVDVVMNTFENKANTQFKLPTAKASPDSNNDNKTENTVSEDVTEHEEVISKNINTGEIRHITDVENTLKCSERYWILIYAFYISNHGKSTFSKSSLFQKYKEQRETDSRIANFSNKWKSLFKGLVETIKTEEFKLTDKGIETVIGLINGTIKSEASNSIPSKKSAKQNGTSSENESHKKTAKTSAKSVQAEEFDLSKNTKKLSLSDFLTQHQIGENTANRILAIAYYIKAYCKVDSFTDGNIEYAYVVLKLNKRPVHLHQTIVNLKVDNLWFEKHDATGKWKLARAGEIYFDDNLVKSK